MADNLVYPTATLLALATYTSSGTGLGSVVTPSFSPRGAAFELIVTAASTSGSAGPTLDVYIQSAMTDPSSSGIPYDDFIHFPQVTTIGNTVAVWARDITPSSSNNLRVPAAGALAVGTVRHGPITGQNMRVQYVVSSTSQGSFRFAVIGQLWP